MKEGYQLLDIGQGMVMRYVNILNKKYLIYD